MSKFDYKKEFKQFYTAKPQPLLVTVPSLKYFMIEGIGDPNTSKRFEEAVQTLYALSYTLKFHLKKLGKHPDYSIPPLQALWWADDMENFVFGNKDLWRWNVMLMQPDFISEEIFSEGKKLVRDKKGDMLLNDCVLFNYEEGETAQILHIGPYADEEPTIKRLHDFIHSKGFKLKGKHHEIYLSDPRKAAPEKIKTIIRQPYQS